MPLNTVPLKWRNYWKEDKTSPEMRGPAPYFYPAPRCKFVCSMLRFLLLLFLLCGCSLSAQHTLTGSLTDETTGEPVAFATVYLDGTSKGEVTGDDGTFTLTDVSLPATLVVSHLNYDNQTLNLTAPGPPLTLRLSPQDAVLTGVEVTDRNTRAETLAEFRELLLGKDAWGKKAVIRNEEALRFDRDYYQRTLTVDNEKIRSMLLAKNRRGARWSEDGTTYTYEQRKNLKAISLGPLQIDLPHLGYQLRMDLSEFRADYQEGRRAYLGTFFFSEADKVKKKHLRNRERAYLGSAMHFARSLLSGNLARNGFKVVEVIKHRQPKREEIQEIELTDYLHQVSDHLWELRGLQGRDFAVLYYGDGRQRPLPPWKWDRTQPVQASFHVDGERCLLIAGGGFGDANIAFSGYMGTRGLAWGLPVDYTLE